MRNDTDLSRRSLMAGAGALFVTGAPALALTTAQARSLIEGMVNEITRVINSGRSRSAMYREFTRIFGRYADLGYIAPFIMGPAWRSASSSQRRNFTNALQSYIGRKYGSRFGEFIGGRVEVQGARPVKSFHEVRAVALLRGESPFDVTFIVSDRSGRNRFLDMRVEGVSLLKAEKEQIGAMLDRRRGNIDAMISDLSRAG